MARPVPERINIPTPQGASAELINAWGQTLATQLVDIFQQYGHTINSLAVFIEPAEEDQYELVGIPVLPNFTDLSRPPASDLKNGAAIWNTDDGAPNFVNGSNWVDAQGNTT